MKKIDKKNRWKKLVKKLMKKSIKIDAKNWWIYTEKEEDSNRLWMENKFSSKKK